MRFYYFMAALLLLTGPAWSQPDLQLESFSSGFTQPVVITHANDYRMFVVQQNGIIRIVGVDGSVFSSPFLNITDRVNNAGSERGLLGLAFHPDYADNGFFYVYYTGDGGDTYVSRFSVTVSDPDIADPDSELILLTADQPFSNHNAGEIAFGPDGYLYIATGDGGSANDPQNNSQNTQNLLGNILRIDVDNPDPGSNYGIPSDNPYVNDPNVLDEIWAYGLRNPWRFSFDRLTGDLWIADVGQNEWEEINFQPADSPGGENYGWRCYEGNEPFITSGCGDPDEYTFPAFVYPHSGTNGCSVTGGYVYRGCRYPGMYGHFIFADYCSGQFWSLEPDGSGGFIDHQLINGSNFQFTTFGENAQGELFVAAYGSGTILRVTDTSSGPFVVSLTTTETTCELAADGSIALNWPGGNDPVNVDWSNGAMGQELSGLEAGNYIATVTGGNGCQVTLVAEVEAGTPDSLMIDGLGTDSLITDSGFESYQWLLEGDTILGATDSIYEPTQTGIYSVTAIDEFGCVHFSPELAIFIQSAYEWTNLQTVRLFPNPAREWLQVALDLKKAESGTWTVIDNQGQIRLQDSWPAIPDPLIQVNLSDLPAGMYWLRLQAEDRAVYRRFVRM